MVAGGPAGYVAPAMPPRTPTRSAVDGALALAAAMGIGRFAYTALLPATQRALAVGDDGAGAIASVNLAGYLAGVLAARHVATSPRRARALRLGLGLTAVATFLGALTTSPAAWAVLRGAAGIASGLVFVLASAAALEIGAPAGKLYGGVGFGIALSGAAAATIPGAAGWNAPWLLLGALAAALAVPAWQHLAPIAPRRREDSGPLGDGATLGFGLGRLSAAYFLEGLGYIVSGTFAVAAVRRTPGLEALAPWTWVLTGLAAAPSAMLWAWAGRRVGLRRALVLAHLAQAFGMALPSLSSSAGAALAGAALFGGTFVGIVALTMSAARVLAPEAPGRIVGTLTAIYGVGQIIGPIAAGALSQRLADPRPGVLAAAAAVAAGGLLLVPRHRAGA
jgi:predicted MFS family arabinose efflux permease